MKTEFKTLLLLTFCCFLPATAVFAQKFQRLYGNNLENYFIKIIPEGPNYYVLGYEDNYATVSHILSNGQLDWTIRFIAPCLLTDAAPVFTSPGQPQNLMVVGFTLPFDNTNKSLLAIITPAGVVTHTQEYDNAGNEGFIRIAQNPGGTYAVVGFVNSPGAANNVLLMNVSGNGAVNTANLYGNTGDNGYFYDIEILGTDQLVAGYDGNAGVIFRLDNSPIPNFVAGVRDPSTARYDDLALDGTDIIAAGAPAIPGGLPLLRRFDANLLPVWTARVSNIDVIQQVEVSPTNGDIYAVGTKTVSGVGRVVVLRIDDSGGTPTLVWAKHLDNGENAHATGYITMLPSGDIALADGKTGIPNGFGQGDAFLAVTDENLNSYCTEIDSVAINSDSPFLEGLAPDFMDFTSLNPVSPLDFNAVNWQQAALCTIEPCPNNLAQNPDFTVGANPGPMPAPGTLADWQAAYGTPVVFPGFGCADPVYVQLEGNKTGGSAIFQQLAAPIQKGKVYELSVCVRVSGISHVPYVKLRGLAFNNALPAGGGHPMPGQDIAVMDVSGRIAACDDWTTFVFHRWRAGSNFNNIAISVENSEAPGLNLISVADIDNICFAEVNDSIPCYLAELDSAGNLIFPGWQPNPNCPPLDDEVDVFMGSVNDIYAYCNPAPDGLDTWYEGCPDSCESIGGEIPDELIDFIENDSLNNYLQDSLGVNDSTLLADMGHLLDSLMLANPSPNMLDSIAGIGALSVDCRSLPAQGPPPDDSFSPFNGRDIVFVHGLRTDPLEDRLMGLPGGLTKWPADRQEFYSGYWKRGAYDYWNTHTDRYLKTRVSSATLAVSHAPTGPYYSNRYLVVAHPATQSFALGAHSVMEQIANAMLDGTGVINCDPGELRPKNTFGHNGYIIISHSDGAPLSDIVLTTSSFTRYPPQSMLLGDVSFVADRCELHVALQGAFGGSNFAALVLMASTSGLQYIKPISNALLGFEVNPTSTAWLFTSQLLDMAITRHLWAPFMDHVPVCVLTLAGGHPTDFGADKSKIDKALSILVKHGIHHGYDDGVLSLESQTANPDIRPFYPNRYLPSPGKLTPFNPLLNEKLFDMGINTERSVRYYLDQKNDIRVAETFISPAIPSCFGAASRYLFAASACVPWLSPTGMVQPVRAPGCLGFPAYDALKRYKNHHSFLQSAADHFSGSIGPFTNHPDYEKTYGTGAANFEESRVITSPAVYLNCGVSFPRMSRLQVEYVRGKSRTFKLFKKTRTLWIWKRKYHLLWEYEKKNQVDYLYENVFK